MKGFKLLGGMKLCKSKGWALLITTAVLTYVMHFALQKTGV